MEGRKTDFLTAKGTFIDGLGSVLDLFGYHFIYNSSSSGEEADARALAMDWFITGDDIRRAIKNAQLPSASK